MNTEVEQALLVPLFDESDPDEMPTQRIRLSDLEGTAAQALLEQLRRMEQPELISGDVDGTLEPGPEVTASPSFTKSPAPARATRSWTPATAFTAGFTTLSVLQLTWWLLA